MKYKLTTYIMFSFCILLLWPQHVISADTASKPKTVIIDPWYGGNESGPLIAHKKYGKNITLAIAQKLQGLLEVSGFRVYLTRSADEFVTIEHRLYQGKSKNANVHVAVKVSQSKNECVHILMPELAVTKPQAKNETHNTEELGKMINEIIDGLKADEIREDSLLLAHKISSKLKKILMHCVEVRRGKDYLLKNAQLPTVLLDFQVSPTGKQSFIINDASLDKIAKSVTDSIKEHFEEREIN